MVKGAQAFQSAWVVPRGAGMTLTALRALWRTLLDDAHVIAQQSIPAPVVIGAEVHDGVERPTSRHDGRGPCQLSFGP